MDAIQADPVARQREARRELDAMAHGGKSGVLLRIDCPASHHVARVVRTAAGLVYETVPQRHSHGDRDRYDGTHHASERGHWADFLEGSDDPLPAGCECGSLTLDRADVRRHVHRSAPRWVLERP